jgi:hypothetical protein
LFWGKDAFIYQTNAILSSKSLKCALLFEKKKSLSIALLVTLKGDKTYMKKVFFVDKFGAKGV